MTTNHSFTITRSLELLSVIVPLAIGTAYADENSAPERRAKDDLVTATITHMLPADGCSYPVTIDGIEYAPDAESTERIQQMVSFGTTTALVSYSLTGETGVVQCGFGATRELPEISVRVRRILDESINPG